MADIYSLTVLLTLYLYFHSAMAALWLQAVTCKFDVTDGRSVAFICVSEAYTWRCACCRCSMKNEAHCLCCIHVYVSTTAQHPKMFPTISFQPDSRLEKSSLKSGVLQVIHQIDLTCGALKQKLLICSLIHLEDISYVI